jgi:hypothetical protein
MMFRLLSFLALASTTHAFFPGAATLCALFLEDDGCSLVKAFDVLDEDFVLGSLFPFDGGLFDLHSSPPPPSPSPPPPGSS